MNDFPKSDCPEDRGEECEAPSGPYGMTYAHEHCPTHGTVMLAEGGGGDDGRSIGGYESCRDCDAQAEYLKTRFGATGAKQLLSDFLAEIANCNDAAYLQRELSTLGSLGPLIGSVKLEIKSRLPVLGEQQKVIAA